MGSMAAVVWWCGLRQAGRKCGVKRCGRTQMQARAVSGGRIHK